MKKRILSIAIATVMTLGVAPIHASTELKDIDSSRYKDAIEYVYEEEIMTGDSSDRFRPADTITRAELATTIAKWQDLKIKGSPSFPDAKNHWASKYIAAVEKKGLMGGNPDGNFDPNGNITYREAIKVMVGAIDKSEEAEEFGGYPEGYLYTAKRYGISKDVSGSEEAPIYRGAVAQMIQNSSDFKGNESIDDNDKLGIVDKVLPLEGKDIRTRTDVELGAIIEKLPDQVGVKLSSGKTVFLKINWDTDNTSYNKNSKGKHTIKGYVELPDSIKDPNKKITTIYASIEVVDEEAEASKKVVNSVQGLSPDISVGFGTSVQSARGKLPEEVNLFLAGAPSVKADISWTIEDYNELKPGKYKAVGRVRLPDGVVDSLGVVKNLEGNVKVEEEDATLNSIEIKSINPNTVKITANRLIRDIFQNETVKVYEIDESGDRGNRVSLRSIDHGDSKNELVVKFADNLNADKIYEFEVKDAHTPREAVTQRFSLAEKEYEIDRVEVSDYVVPAGEELGKIRFRAFNKSGLDITDSVRHRVKVKTSARENTIQASENITDSNDEGVELGDKEVLYYYLEYQDSSEKWHKTAEKRVIGERRVVKEIRDWTIASTSPTPNFSKSINYIEEKHNDNSMGLHIRVDDQFGDIDKVEYDASQVEVKVRSGADVLGATKGSSFKPVATVGAKKKGRASLEISIGSGTNKVSRTVSIDVIENLKPVALRASQSRVELSSSFEFRDSAVVDLSFIDQKGNTISSNKDIGARIRDSRYSIKGGEIFKGTTKIGQIEQSSNEFTIKTKDNINENFNIEFYVEGDSSIRPVSVSALFKRPGIATNIIVEGFKGQMTSSDTMELKLFEVDSNKVKVRQIEDGRITVIDLSKEEDKEVIDNSDSNNFPYKLNGDGELKGNKAYEVVIKVGEIIVLKENITVK